MSGARRREGRGREGRGGGGDEEDDEGGRRRRLLGHVWLCCRVASRARTLLFVPIDVLWTRLLSHGCASARNDNHVVVVDGTFVG